MRHAIVLVPFRLCEAKLLEVGVRLLAKLEVDQSVGGAVRLEKGKGSLRRAHARNLPVQREPR